MPTYALALLFILSGYFDFITTALVKRALFSIVIFNTLLMPLLITWLLRRRGYIKSLQMEERHERILPFICSAILMLITYYMLQRLALLHIFSLLLLGAASATIIAVLITFRWKISIHMIGIGGISGMLFALSNLMIIDLRIPLIISLLVAGIIGVARLSMQSHQQMQIYAGFFIGFLCEFAVLYI
jgi:hypothetical protein